MIFPFLHSFSIQICFDCTLDVPSLYYLPIHFKSYIEALKFKSYIIIPNLLYIVLLNIVCAYYTIQVFVQSSALFLFPKCFCLGLGDGEISVQDEQLSSHSMHLSLPCVRNEKPVSDYYVCRKSLWVCFGPTICSTLLLLSRSRSTRSPQVWLVSPNRFHLFIGNKILLTKARGNCNIFH